MRTLFGATDLFPASTIRNAETTTKQPQPHTWNRTQGPLNLNMAAQVEDSRQAAERQGPDSGT
jgi:hypothetical protein